MSEHVSELEKPSRAPGDVGRPCAPRPLRLPDPTGARSPRGGLRGREGGWSRPLTPTGLAGVCRPSTQQLCRPPAEPPAAPGRLWARLRRPEARPPAPFGDPRPPPQLRLDGPFSGLNDSHSLVFWTARACRLLGPRNYRLPERRWLPPLAARCRRPDVGARRSGSAANEPPRAPCSLAPQHRRRASGREGIRTPGAGLRGTHGDGRWERPAPGAHGARGPRSPAV